MQICDFNTQLNFGKHKGKTIQQLIDESEFNYLLWCLRNHDGICFTEEVFNVIKDKDVASSELIISILDGDAANDKIIKERDALKLEIINLKKVLSTYQSAGSRLFSNKERYLGKGNSKKNWLSEAAGSNDIETMNDVYWNLD